MRLFIDVREPSEFAVDHVPGAINIPPAQIMHGTPGALVDVDTDTQLILYCRSGARSHASMYYLRQYGFTNLVNGINKDQVMARFSTDIISS
ncbi:rhodanese-like domain-containing protein [Candidatus Saccharibacteria bacterium]|nr:rhodanese-like domain-containing protein [Candidatus Saccharibacteria bacterium]